MGSFAHLEKYEKRLLKTYILFFLLFYFVILYYWNPVRSPVRILDYSTGIFSQYESPLIDCFVFTAIGLPHLTEFALAD